MIFTLIRLTVAASDLNAQPDICNARKAWLSPPVYRAGECVATMEEPAFSDVYDQRKTMTQEQAISYAVGEVNI